MSSEEKKESESHGEAGHVHGPNCNHGGHQHDTLAPQTRTAPKVGRNDPCTCGSKKKYKKCCGQ